jgi:arginine exporter protein ArgO
VGMRKTFTCLNPQNLLLKVVFLANLSLNLSVDFQYFFKCVYKLGFVVTFEALCFVVEIITSNINLERARLHFHPCSTQIGWEVYFI